MNPDSLYHAMASHFNAQDYPQAHCHAIDLLHRMMNGESAPSAFPDRRTAMVAAEAMIASCRSLAPCPRGWDAIDADNDATDTVFIAETIRPDSIIDVNANVLLFQAHALSRKGA